MREYKQEKALAIYLPLFQCLLNMTGASPNAALLYGEAITREDYEEKKISNATVQSYQMQLAYYFDDMELAQDMSTRLQEVSQSFNAHYLFVARKFFFGLIALRAAMDAEEEKARRSNVSQARKVINEMEEWARHGGLNCLAKVLILKAELKAFEFLHWKRRCFSKKEDLLTVRGLYDTAIATAIRSGFTNYAALACERTSIFLERCKGDDYWVSSYMSRAVDYYKSWGAQAKVDRLILNQSRKMKSLVFPSRSSSGSFVVGQHHFRKSCVTIHEKVGAQRHDVEASKERPTRSHRLFSGGALMKAAAAKNGLLGGGTASTTSPATHEPSGSFTAKDETERTSASM